MTKPKKETNTNPQTSDACYIEHLLTGALRWVCRVTTVIFDVTSGNFEVIDKNYLNHLQKLEKEKQKQSKK